MGPAVEEEKDVLKFGEKDNIQEAKSLLNSFKNGNKFAGFLFALKHLHGEKGIPKNSEVGMEYLREVSTVSTNGTDLRL
jgi:hypothetical protein